MKQRNEITNFELDPNHHHNDYDNKYKRKKVDNDFQQRKNFYWK